LLSRLTGLKQTAKGWVALCPAHADKSPSLSIRLADDGKILLHCFAGCATQR
jgi:DNA primase